MYSSSPIGLSLCSWNAKRLLRRNAELRIFIEKHSPDILLIQETHLRPSHNFNIANYTCHRNDRITDGSRTAGGTLILVKNSLKHHCLPTPPLRALEATNIILTPPKHNPISITSVYIPPFSDENLFTLDIEYFIQTANNCVLFGDFNASHTAWNCNHITNRGRHLYNFANMPPGQPIGVTVHFTQQPIREQLLNSKPRQKPTILTKHRSHASRIPSFNQSSSCHSAERKIPLSPCPSSKTCPEMGLRTVFTVQKPKKATPTVPDAPKSNAYSSRRPKRNAHSIALFVCRHHVEL
ncbi:putative RNA-directed DNA polymerase from transposon X-element [Trichonephila clavipes]|nr:putative RNA-directed DNA polymerase from transposon X-element [Trichonephila clavipes]